MLVWTEFIALIFLIGLLDCKIEQLIGKKNKFAAEIFKSHANEDILEYGAPSNCTYMKKVAYLNCYDNEKRLPTWIYERLTTNNFINVAERDECNFKRDPEIEREFSASDSSYKKSGFDRGHMAPAAHHQDSHEAICSTFYYSNTVPQNARLNRVLWAKIERFVETITARSNSHAHVITGPLFIASNINGKNIVEYEVLTGNVAVPTHLFKVILVKIGDEFSSYSFLIKNSDGFKKDMQEYLVDMSVIEDHGGFQFFPDLERDQIIQQKKIYT